MTTRLQAVINRNQGRYHRIAAELGVNVFWVYQYIKHGREPRNPEIRRKMRLPKPRRTQASGKAKLPEHERWWRKLDKAARDEIKRQLWMSRSS